MILGCILVRSKGYDLKKVQRRIRTDEKDTDFIKLLIKRPSVHIW